MAKKKNTERPKAHAVMKNMGTGASHGAKTHYVFHGRTVEVMRPSAGDLANARDDKPAMGMLRIDGRDVMYEQTDEGVYSHELMYQRFSTPEALAEELVRQWGTHLPPPLPMHHEHND